MLYYHRESRYLCLHAQRDGKSIILLRTKFNKKATIFVYRSDISRSDLVDRNGAIIRSRETR